MRFKIWLNENLKSTRVSGAAMGQRRKDRQTAHFRKKAKHHNDYNHGERDQVAGNVRHSGKGGFGSTQHPNDFRSQDNYENLR